MTQQPLDNDRLTEIEESHPGDWYAGEWRTEYVDSTTDQPAHYRVKHQESGHVLAELPDFAGGIALFIADAHDAVPAMAAEIRRLRADASEQQAEIAKLIRWHGEDETAMKKMRGTIERLRTELAEKKASHDPRLRGLLVKAAPDKDQYVLWSTVCDMPGGVFSRETAIEYGFPPSRLDQADRTGSSSRIGDGAWDDKGWVAEQRGWLRRELLGDYAVEYLHGDREAAYALLEPFDDDLKDDETAAARP